MKYDAEATRRFFDAMATSFSNARVPRNEIFFQLILRNIRGNGDQRLKVLDFGCGGGGFIVEMLSVGIDAYGIEASGRLCEIAQERLYKSGHDPARVVRGNIQDLASHDSSSFDLVTAMGVFQYLPIEGYSSLLRHIHRILRKHGRMVASYQNALFDLFTFNKYTIEFMREEIFKRHIDDPELLVSIEEDLRSLLTYYDKPEYSPLIARDNIFVRTSNPLTIAKELESLGFEMIEKYFYSFYLVPRLIESKYLEALRGIASGLEVQKSTEWYGHFMANAFVVDTRKQC